MKLFLTWFYTPRNIKWKDKILLCFHRTSNILLLWACIDFIFRVVSSRVNKRWNVNWVNSCQCGSVAYFAFISLDPCFPFCHLLLSWGVGLMAGLYSVSISLAYLRKNVCVWIHHKKTLKSLEHGYISIRVPHHASIGYLKWLTSLKFKGFSQIQKITSVKPSKMRSNNHRISGVTNFLKPPNEPEKKKEQEETQKEK